MVERNKSCLSAPNSPTKQVKADGVTVNRQHLGSENTSSKENLGKPRKTPQVRVCFLPQLFMGQRGEPSGFLPPFCCVGANCLLLLLKLKGKEMTADAGI